MSRPDPQRTPTTPLPSLRRPKRALSAAGGPNRPPTRRPSFTGGLTRAAGIPPVPGQKQAQRTSKTTQKLVVLPSAPQTKPLAEDDEDIQHGYETDRGVRDVKSEGERMSKEQRQKAGYKRITAYCVSEGFKMKLLTGFLKREHNVQPRVFDEAVYAMYHLPLLPGYGPGINVRSSAAPSTIPTPTAEDIIAPAEGEETADEGVYFPSSLPTARLEGFSPGTSPLNVKDYATDVETPKLATADLPASSAAAPQQRRASPSLDPDTFGEAIFFQYGVVVFFGLDVSQEHSILEDVEGAGIMVKPLPEDRWEVEECHYEALHRLSTYLQRLLHVQIPLHPPRTLRLPRTRPINPPSPLRNANARHPLRTRHNRHTHPPRLHRIPEVDANGRVEAHWQAVQAETGR